VETPATLEKRGNVRIGFDAKRAFFNSTGLGVYSREIISEALNSPEIDEVFLYSPPVKKAPFADFFKRKGKAHLREPSGFFSKLIPSLWRSYRLAEESVRDKLDLFHGLSFELPTGIEKTGIRTVVNIHDLIFVKYPALYKSIDRKVYEYKTRISSRSSDAVITISQQTKDDLCHYTGINPDKVHVIYPSCSDRFRQELRLEALNFVLSKYSINPPFVLFVSSITERKNLKTLVRALGLIRNKTDVALVVAGKGKGPYLKAVKDTIAELQLERRVHFIGHVDDDDLPALYKAASVFAYPSFYEGFGLPVIEALASGTPVLAATGSCLEEAGGEGALYIDPQDEKEMAEKLYALLTDAELRYTLCEKGKIHADKFTPLNSRDSLLKLYKSLQ
jgi:glycosyltransferase involved in cell wall biosynthesis